jgi:hypothetical protein
MALNKDQFKTDINTLLESLFTNSGSISPAEARTQFVNGLADAVENYIKSGDGIYQPGKLQAGANPVVSVGTGAAIKIQ